jgi:hypothetical protein
MPDVGPEAVTQVIVQRLHLVPGVRGLGASHQPDLDLALLRDVLRLVQGL